MPDIFLTDSVQQLMLEAQEMKQDHPARSEILRLQKSQSTEKLSNEQYQREFAHAQTRSSFSTERGAEMPRRSVNSFFARERDLREEDALKPATLLILFPKCEGGEAKQ